jgi:Ca2+-transporting ATPase
LHEDPFLYADSLFVRGTCKALVCCVGDNCVRRNSVTKYDTTTDTRLKKKLDNLGARFTLYSIYATIFILICLIIALSIQLGTRTDAEAKANPIGSIILAKISKIVVFIVVILVVCIPEGLPMTIEVALAFSVNRMFKDKILVRNLSAPEYMGSVEEICCGKTGTITMNNMKVSQFNCEGRQVKNTRKDTLLHCELSTNTVELIKESILYNCEARIEMDATSYIPVGNGTEVALLKFLQDAEVPVHLLIQRKLGRIRAISPFSSEKKRSAVALECPDRPQRVAVYVKGAPEVIINLCHSIAGARGSGMFGNDEKARMLDTVASMASNPLRVISFAFTEMDLEDWLALEGRGGTPERALEDALSNGALALTFIGAFGLRDPLRPSVSSAVKYARDSGKLWVRLVSGDHIETAKAVALKSGILRAEEAGRLYSVMSAEDFRQTVGQIIEDDGIGMPNVENEMAFKEIIANLRVLARATAADKLLLVTGLKALGKCVSVTGDGINDVVALERADVGLAMGSGCSAAKESSDIILTDDDFEASLRAVMWGRNIFHNISRFL